VLCGCCALTGSGAGAALPPPNAGNVVALFAGGGGAGCGGAASSPSSRSSYCPHSHTLTRSASRAPEPKRQAAAAHHCTRCYFSHLHYLAKLAVVLALGALLNLSGDPLGPARLLLRNFGPVELGRVQLQRMRAHV